MVAMLSRYIRRAASVVSADNLQSRLARGVTGTLGFQIAGIGLSFAMGLLLARLLGAQEYGEYVFAMAWVTLLGVPATLGLDRLLVRYVATYQAHSSWALLSGLLQWATRAVLITSMGLALVVILTAQILTRDFDFQDLNTLQLAVVFVPFASLTTIRRATMQGLHHVLRGQLPEGLIRPLLFILLLWGCRLSLERLSSAWAVGLNGAAIVITLLAATRLQSSVLPEEARGATPIFWRRGWLQTAIPLMLVSGATMIGAQVNQIMLGIMADSEAVGVYSVVNRGAQFVMLPLGALNVALAPTIASLYASAEKDRLQRVITRGARVALLMSLPVVLAFSLFGYWFLLLFGQEFTQGQAALSILSFGQLINVAVGLAGALLLMTGHERDVAWSVTMGTLVNVGLNVILIPRWGVVGAAAAASVGLIGWNIATAILACHRLGIHSTALGPITLCR